jgi:hypothetical protein
MQDMEGVGYRNNSLLLLCAPQERLLPRGVWPRALAREASPPDVIFRFLVPNPTWCRLMIQTVRKRPNIPVPRRNASTCRVSRSLSQDSIGSSIPKRGMCGGEGASLLDRSLGNKALSNLTRRSLSRVGIGDDGFIALVFDYLFEVWEAEVDRTRLIACPGSDTSLCHFSGAWFQSQLGAV